MQNNYNGDVEINSKNDEANLKYKDKFLSVIVVGAVLLTVIAFAVVLLRPKPEYQSENTPAGIAHNYLLALEKRNYERAYKYLAPSLQGRPDSVDEFYENIENYSRSFRLDSDVTVQVESESIFKPSAVVIIRETRFDGGGIFDSNQTTDTFRMKLRLDDNEEWRVIDSDYYFASCWQRITGCR